MTAVVNRRHDRIFPQTGNHHIHLLENLLLYDLRLRCLQDSSVFFCHYGVVRKSLLEFETYYRLCTEIGYGDRRLVLLGYGLLGH